MSLTNPTITTFLLYSNSLTSLIGITTLLLFWIPIPILHFLGWEPFEAPPSYTLLPIVGIVLMGVVFNAGFMVLLSLWGPVVAVSLLVSIARFSTDNLSFRSLSAISSRS